MRSNIKYHYFLFLIWPFLALVLALRKGFNKRYQGIILAFSFLYGYSVYLYSGDILGYEETFAVVVNYSWSDFWFLLTHKLDPVALSTYAPNGVNRKPDIFALVVSFLSSRLTDNPRLFWGIVSLVYTWFMLLFFNEVKKHFSIQKSWIHYILVFFFIIVIPKYVGVTGVRFWLALFLFMYFLMKYVNTEYSFKYIFAASLACLIHYSLFVPTIFVLIFHFIPLKKYFTKILVVVSLLFFLLSSTTGIFNFLSKAVEATDETTVGQSMESYADEDIYKQRSTKRKSTNWYVQFRANAHYYLFFILFLGEVAGFFKLRETLFTERHLPMLVLFFCVALLTFNLGSIGRFKNIFLLLILTRYVVLYQYNMSNKFYKVLGYSLVPIVIIYFFVLMRAELYYIEPQLLVNNSIGLFLTRSTESLSEFIVGH